MKRIVVLLTVVLFVFSFCACGDTGWDIDLINGYSINKMNSNEIFVVNEDGRVLYNFFVTSFQIHDPYICIKGIKTNSYFRATEEEIRARITVCYLVNTETDELTGPYENEEEFRAYCKEAGIIMDELWMPASYKVSEQFNNE